MTSPSLNDCNTSAQLGKAFLHFVLTQTCPGMYHTCYSRNCMKLRRTQETLSQPTLQSTVSILVSLISRLFATGLKRQQRLEYPSRTQKWMRQCCLGCSHISPAQKRHPFGRVESFVRTDVQQRITTHLNLCLLTGSV